MCGGTFRDSFARRPSRSNSSPLASGGIGAPAAHETGSPAGSRCRPHRGSRIAHPGTGRSPGPRGSPGAGSSPSSTSTRPGSCCFAAGRARVRPCRHRRTPPVHPESQPRSSRSQNALCAAVGSTWHGNPLELRAVTVVSGCQDEGGRSASPFGGEMDLGGEASAGTVQTPAVLTASSSWTFSCRSTGSTWFGPRPASPFSTTAAGGALLAPAACW